RLRAADLELQVVLVAGADLPDRERSLRAVVEADEHRRQILDGDVDVGRGAAAPSLERLARAGRLPALLDGRRDVAEDVRGAGAAAGGARGRTGASRCRRARSWHRLCPARAATSSRCP